MLESPWEWVKAHNPLRAITGLNTNRLNFITIHCGSESISRSRFLLILIDLYVLFLAILGSVLLYPAGGMHYIDALFFASGCATQSGLNTYGLRSLLD